MMHRLSDFFFFKICIFLFHLQEGTVINWTYFAGWRPVDNVAKNNCTIRFRTQNEYDVSKQVHIDILKLLKKKEIEHTKLDYQYFLKYHICWHNVIWLLRYISLKMGTIFRIRNLSVLFKDILWIEIKIFNAHLIYPL